MSVIINRIIVNNISKVRTFLGLTTKKNVANAIEKTAKETYSSSESHWLEAKKALQNTILEKDTLISTQKNKIRELDDKNIDLNDSLKKAKEIIDTLKDRLNKHIELGQSLNEKETNLMPEVEGEYSSKPTFHIKGNIVLDYSADEFTETYKMAKPFERKRKPSQTLNIYNRLYEKYIIPDKSLTKVPVGKNELNAYSSGFRYLDNKGNTVKKIFTIQNWQSILNFDKNGHLTEGCHITYKEGSKQHIQNIDFYRIKNGKESLYIEIHFGADNTPEKITFWTRDKNSLLIKDLNKEFNTIHYELNYSKADRLKRNVEIDYI